MVEVRNQSLEIKGKSYSLPQWGLYNLINSAAVLAIEELEFVAPQELDSLLHDFQFLPYRFSLTGTAKVIL